MAQVKQGRGYVYCIQYHIVWCVKYRRKVLFGDVDKSLKEIILKIANDNNFEISEMETDKDYTPVNRMFSTTSNSKYN